MDESHRRDNTSHICVRGPVTMRQCRRLCRLDLWHVAWCQATRAWLPHPACWSAADEFGDDRLAAARTGPAEGCTEQILAAVDAFTGGVFDDAQH